MGTEKRAGGWRWLAVAAVLLAAILGLQAASGAWRADLAGQPDEAAHAVTGLMLRDYLFGGGLPGNPKSYAENYYDHYPKIGLGVWPPGFYVIQAMWTAGFGASVPSLMGLMAAFALGVALLTAGLVRWATGNLWWGLAGALLLLLSPLGQEYLSLVMTEYPVTFFSLLAVLGWARWMERPSWWRAGRFAAAAIAAIYVKNSAYALALLPPLATLLTGRWAQWRQPSLWGAAAAVAAVCLPWSAYSVKLNQTGWAASGFSVDFTREAAGYNVVKLGEALGWGVAALALAGAVVVCWRRAQGGAPAPVEPLAACLAAYAVAVPVFHSLVPAGMEARHLVPVLPVLVVFAAALLAALARHPAAWARPAAAVAALLAGGLYAAHSLQHREGPLYTKDEENCALAALPDSFFGAPGDKWLVSGSARTEGAFIARLALADAARPSRVVDRTSKVLADSDWRGRGYQQAFASPEELRDFLLARGYRGVAVLHPTLWPQRPPHAQQLEAVLEGYPQLFAPAEVPAGHGFLRVWRVKEAEMSTGRE